MNNYTPRLTAPTTDNPHFYAENPFEWSGYGLPNCTAYAWGRFYEVLGSTPKLSLGNAEEWYIYDDGYKRGSVPQLGAVACWRKGVAGDNSDGAGHVAIVEEIYSDGSILTGESGWGASSIFWTTKRPKDGNWGASSAYTFQGFIYNPAVSTKPTLLVWAHGNRYLSTAEQQNNAQIIANYLLKRGWTLNAIAAILGNMEAESTINPGIWESLTSDPQTFYNANGRWPGFGLVQWTPYTKYTNWAGTGSTTGSWYKQLDRIIYEMENNIQYYPTVNYPETFREFSQSTKSAYYLAGAFLFNYERPAAQYADPEKRGKLGEKWYNYLLTVPGLGGLRLPVWLLFKLKERSML